jgi:hypothetical protein
MKKDLKLKLHNLNFSWNSFLSPWYKYVWNVICVHYVMFNKKFKIKIKTTWFKFILEFISIHFVMFNGRGL